MIVKKEAGPYHPARPQLRHVRHDEARRADEVGRDLEQNLALGESFRNQPELILLKIAQAAVDQLAASGAGMRAEVVFLHQQDGEPAPGSVAGDAGAVDAAADD